MRSFKKASLFILASAALFTACKYEEGPGISFRSKRDRIANEWKITGYQVDGQDDDAAKNSFRSGDSIELIFTMTRNYHYAMNMAYTDNYTSPTGNKILSPNAQDDRTYQDILGGFKTGNKLFRKIAQSGKWAFSDKFKQVHFGANGNGDLAYPEGDDSTIVKSDIIMLKNKMLKLEFNIEDKKHRITFEPKNPEIVKED